MQIVLDEEQGTRYLVKYVSKPEKESMGMKYLLHSVIPNNVPDEEETKGEEPTTIYVPTLVCNIAIKSIAERDKSKQEIRYSILQ